MQQDLKKHMIHAMRYLLRSVYKGTMNVAIIFQWKESLGGFHNEVWQCLPVNIRHSRSETG